MALGHGFRLELPPALRASARHTLRVVAGPEQALLEPVPSFWVKGRPESGWEETAFELETSPPDEKPDDLRRWGPILILGTGMLLCALTLLLISQHLGCYADEWSFAMKRRGWDPDAFLMAHNGHFVLVSTAVYKFLYLIVGLAHSWPYRLALVLFHFACVGLIYVLAAKRFGRWLALVPAGLVLLPGSSSDDLLWSFQISFVSALAFGLGALVCLDREERRFDIAAAALVFLSLASSAVGLAFGIGILAELIVTRRHRHRLFVALVPFALYGLWYIGFHTSENRLLAENVTALPGYDLRRAGQEFAGFANLPLLLGKLLLVVTAVLLVIKAWTDRHLPPRALVGIVGALVFWSLAGLARAQLSDPVATRYIYPSMVFILIAVIPCLPRPRAVSWQVGAVLAAIVGFAIVNNYGPVKSYADFRTHEDALTATDYSAEAIANRPNDPWVKAVRDLDFPLLSARELMKLPPEFQLRADDLLVRADLVEFDRPSPAELEVAKPAPVPDRYSVAERGRTARPLACTRLVPTASDALIALPVPAGRELLLVRAGAKDPEIGVRVRRLSTLFQLEPIEIPPGSLSNKGNTGIVRFLPDSSDLPWYARIELSAPIGLCLV